MTRSRLIQRAAKGQSLVEFALIIPVFILVVMGIFDLGRAVYSYNTVNNAAREAGRLAIVDQTPLHVKTRAQESAANLAVASSDITVNFRSAATPTLANSCATLSIGCIAYVSVDYRFDAVTPIVAQLVGPIYMRGETHFPIEAVCQEPTQTSCPKGS